MTQADADFILGLGGLHRDGDKIVQGPLFDVDVQLVGTDGNAFALMAKVQRGIRQAGGTKADTDAFFAEATSGDYDHLLQVCSKYVNVS